ncbi:MAG TPA: hypothetical protein VM513_25825 [Kofleriaceae bacterium]|nr:hypothetical protein [Kofleriaceae bacterium]
MRAYLAFLVLLTGCDLYLGGDDEPPPPPCYDYGGIGTDGGAALRLRDPSTGECTSFGGGGYPCGDEEQCCNVATLTPTPDWGYCESQCTGLDEQACLGAPGCNASYDALLGIPEDPGSGASYTGCWATSQSGPVQGGGCYNLDAYECARHDDCSMFYDSSGTSFTKFAYCGPEPTTQGCSAVDCGPGSHCEEQCYPCDGVDGPCDMPACFPTCVPDGNTCASTLCGPGTECVEVCEGGTPTDGGMMVPGVCYATCVPIGGGGDPGQCTGPVACDAAPPACPSGTVAGILNACWSGYCIPEADCGPHDPGTCGQAACATPPPACPAGTVAGVSNGCWSGYCIPQASCPQAPCEQLTDEASCTARGDCNAVYTGDNCTCSPWGCTCEDLTFARCESAWVMGL